VLTARLVSTLVVNAFASFIAIIIARRLLTRSGEAETTRALRMFALWWAAFAVDGLLNAATWLAGGLGVANEVVIDVLTYPALVSIVLMSWGLTYYLLFLFTGRASLFRPLAIFYAVSFVAAFALIVSLHPIGVKMGPWAGEITYAHEPPPVAALLFALYFLGPPLIGALAYGSLLLRVKGRASRYRIGAVALGIFVWFVTALAVTGKPDDGAAITIKLVGVVCMLLILSAYFTPAWLQAWLDEGHPSERRLHERSLKREALVARVRELV